MSEQTPVTVIPKKWPIWKTASAAAGVVVLVGGAWFGLHTASEYRAEIEQSQVTAQEYYEGAELQAQLAAESAQDAADSASAAQEAVTSAEAAEAAAAAQAAADAAAAAAAAAAAEAAAKQGGSTGSAAYGSYPSGTKVPFNKSDDPENAAGGDYDVNACASKSASTVNGVPVCD